jgi:hypothetical protein
MKLIIAGGRDYKFTESDLEKLDSIEGVAEVVSGGARGADKCGEIWAKYSSIPITKFPAHWDMYGKGAGHRRNIEMAEYADALAIFPGGRGSANMLEEATKRGLIIFDFGRVQ